MTIYDYKVTQMNGEEVSLETYKGKVVLIVNTASKCGLVKQLTALESLSQTYKEQGLIVLGFPCGQFLGQELKNNEAINEFCQLNYGVTFTMHEKIKVNGKDADPLYQYLVAETGGKKIPWNFTKFLINREGNVVERYDGMVKPEAFEDEIIAQLNS